MNDEAKTKEQLIAELNTLRQRIIELEHTSDQKLVEKNLVEQLPAITYIVEFDEEGSRTTYISPQVETILGFSQAEWLADRQFWVKQLHPEDHDLVMAAVKHSNSIGEALDLEYRVLTRDGRVVWVRNQQTALIKDETGKPQHIHGIMFDVTDQKHLEQRLRQAQRMEAVGQMAGGIAHNFNNVLTALIGHTELALHQASSNQPVHEDLESIKKSAQRAAQLIQQLLAFTRNQAVHPQIINLNDLVLNMHVMIRQLVNEDISLTITPDPELAHIKADPAQIEQVLINLVVNAQDAMPQGGRLTIETVNITINAADANHKAGVDPGRYVMLMVSDTGAGMTEEVKARIFEPFFSTKEVGKGTGLGLASCFGIVRQCKGHILVESEPGRGTIFTIYLPAFVGDIPAPSPVQTETGGLPHGTETILLVEDAFMVRQMAVRVLRRQGYNVLEATNGEEALKLIENKPGLELNLLIADVVMPHMGGNVLAKKLLASHPQLKVLLISGYSDRALERRGVLASDVETLTKPFAPDALIRKVRLILDGAAG